MKVNEAMTAGTDVAAPSTPLPDIARRMRDESIGSIPVGEDAQLAGMVTDRDIIVRCVADGKDSDSATTGDVMSANPTWCYEDADLNEAAHLMEEKRIRRIPVMNRDEQLVGMLSVGDITRASPELAGEALRRNSRVGDQEP